MEDGIFAHPFPQCTYMGPVVRKKNRPFNNNNNTH